jgi:hypothetical protein
MRNFSSPGIPFTFMTHSNITVPELMTYSSGIIYQNCEARKWLFGSLSNITGATLASRLTNWVDYDGSASERGVPTLMGAKGKTTWWRTNQQDCVLSPGEDMYLCDIKEGLSYASIIVVPDRDAANTVGKSACQQNVSFPNAPNTLCPVIGYAKPISTSDPLQVFPIVLMGKINGPVDPRLGGGWHISFEAGAPVKFVVQSIQLENLQSTLLLALPYPSNATFTIRGSQTWCDPLCGNQFSKTHRSFSSLTALRGNAAGDGFFFNATEKLLYLQLAPFDTPPPGYTIFNGVPWTRTSTPFRSAFYREGRVIYPNSGQYMITVTANCATITPGGKYCAI